MRNYRTSDNTARIIHEILAYLSDHPYAQDTLEGITEWWLLEQSIKHQVSKVRAALSELVERGLVIERRRQSVPISYCINPERVSEVQTMVGRGLDGHIVEATSSEV